MKKVIVLMSTYNGSKYIKDQLESLFAQTYPNVEIYVRDDGSKDESVAVLADYEELGKIHLDRGENVGFIKSFFSLIKNAPEADYYAFCDQDDVWEENKIERAVSQMESEDASKPNMYFSDYNYYDQDMNYVGRCVSHAKGPSFHNSLVDCISLGISVVFNKQACSLVKQDIPTQCCGHDWWVYMLCAGLGNVIYDKTPTVRYRRHSNNVSPGGKGFIAFQIWRIKKFLVNDYFKQVRMQLIEYNEIYGEDLSNENKKVLQLFTEKKRFTKAVKKVFYPKLFRQKFVDEGLIRIMFVLGKL